MDAKVKLYKCAKCGERKMADAFGKHADSSTGLQSYCKVCKNGLGKRRMELNTSARLRHHFSTRIASTLGNLAPANLVRDLEVYLGYRMNELTKALSNDLKAREGISLREGLQRGYHVDHIKPLSLFPYVTPQRTVDWDLFKECWAISNLRAISAEDNLTKGAKFGE